MTIMLMMVAMLMVMMTMMLNNDNDANDNDGHDNIMKLAAMRSRRDSHADLCGGTMFA